MANRPVRALRGAELRPHTVLAEGAHQTVRSSLEVEGGGPPEGRASSCEKAFAGHVLSLESHSLLGGKQKVISWAFISKLLKGAVGDSSPLTSVPALAAAGAPGRGCWPVAGAW